MTGTDELVGMVADRLRLMADQVDRLKGRSNPANRAAQVHHLVFSGGTWSGPTGLEELTRRLWIAAYHEETGAL